MEYGYEVSQPCETKLTLRKYLQQRLMNVDGRFARDIEYLFCTQHATDLKQIKADGNFALQLTKGKTFSGSFWYVENTGVDK